MKVVKLLIVMYSRDMELLSARQAATRLGITTAWLHELRKAGKVQATLVGLQYVFDRQEIDRYQQERTEHPPQRGPKRQEER